MERLQCYNMSMIIIIMHRNNYYCPFSLKLTLITLKRYNSSTLTAARPKIVASYLKIGSPQLSSSVQYLDRPLGGSTKPEL